MPLHHLRGRRRRRRRSPHRHGRADRVAHARPPDRTAAQPRAPRAAGRASVEPRRAEELLDAHAGRPVGLTDLAAATGAGVRSIEAAFRLYRHRTPGAFLRARRLVHARRLLLTSPGIAMGVVAGAAGFARVPAFTAAYARVFGERPEDTRRRGLLALGPIPPSIAEIPSAAERAARLSARERQVCAGIARGLLNKQIAAELHLSKRTVKEYRAGAMAKLGATSLAELLSLLREVGM